MIKIYQLILILIAGGCGASIVFRRFIKGELPLYGPEVFSAASKINIDKYDKLLLTVSGIAFTVFIVLTLMNL